VNNFFQKIALAVLWLAATLISIWFWYTLGEGLSGVIMAFTALGLELSKVVLWSRWHIEKKVYALIFGMVFTGLSLAATMGLTIDMLEIRQDMEASFFQATTEWENTLRTLEVDRAALVLERDRLPAGWVTSRIRLTEALIALDARKSTVWDQKPVRQAQTGGVAFRTVLARILNTTPQVLVLVLASILALTLEAGIIVLSKQFEEIHPKSPLQRESMDDDMRIVLEASYRGPDLPLRGRGQLEQERILPTGRLRRAHRKLIQMGFACRKGRDLYPKVS